MSHIWVEFYSKTKDFSTSEGQWDGRQKPQPRLHCEIRLTSQLIYPSLHTNWKQHGHKVQRQISLSPCTQVPIREQPRQGTAYPRKGFTRSRSPFPAMDKRRKHKRAYTNRLYIMNGNNEQSCSTQSWSQALQQSEGEQSPFPGASKLLLSLIHQLPRRSASPHQGSPPDCA